MSDDTIRPDDADEKAVADAIEETVAEPSSIEEEMLVEAAEIEELVAGDGPEHDAESDEAASAPSHPAPDDEVLAAIAADFPEVRWQQVVPALAPAQDEAYVPAESVVAFVERVRDAGYTTFVDLCAVDYLRRAPRFEVVTHLVDTERPARLRIRVGAEAADPSVPTITGVFAGANFYEREAYDMFGIDFPGHPDLTRILMPDDWEGHPLRKDYAVGSVPVQFKGSHKTT
ncbi:MAG: NADH-quinone oxidoreductase subunit C [Acidimicrobiia bacterium]|nr:NADH-quinone oxidoreductase subunit C [Acidimicrobiia bacterium]